MNKLDLILDSVLSFAIQGIVFQEDEITPMDISEWTIKGAVIIDKNNPDLDKQILGTFVTDGTDGLYVVSISDSDKDSVFAIYPKKAGVLYEIKATFADNTGDTLAEGELMLNHSRPLSQK